MPEPTTSQRTARWRPAARAAALGVVVALAAPAAAFGQGVPPADAGPPPSAPSSAAPATPPSPSPASGAPGQQVLALSRKEAIVRALAQNPDLAISRIDVDIALTAIDQAYGEFEPFGFLGGQYAKNRDPSFQREITPGVTFSGLPPGLVVSPTESLSWFGGARMRTQLGPQFDIRYDFFRRETENAFALNPAVTPSFTGTLSIPLLKGFGYDVNRAFITIAQLGHEQSGELFQDAALALALQVEEAYWGFAATVENLKVAEQALVTAEELLRNVRHRLAAGTVADIEVFSAQAGVAAREEALISARNNVLNAQDVLLRLILPPEQLEAWNVRVVLLDAPRTDEDVTNVQNAIETAFEQRPDLHALTLSIQQETVRISRAENDRLPSVNLIGSWQQLGLGDSHHSGHEAVFTGRFYDFTVGFEVEYPLFNIAPRAALREAELRRLRAMRQRDVLEQSIVLDIRTAARDVESGRERIRAARFSRELAERQLQAEQERLREGAVTSFDVLQKQEDLTAAQTVEIGARIDYMRAKARLLRAMGVLLERYDIEVE